MDERTIEQVHALLTDEPQGTVSICGEALVVYGLSQATVMEALSALEWRGEVKRELAYAKSIVASRGHRPDKTITWRLA